ncbi:MAG: membrane protein insertion efficiency factor YidD [Acidimicrobiia bacterium]|nr:membrane protein insertion efficiency factor YidD [Acidimicrobiia bacterium]MYB24902.1 membrane protein insertion efficiency factor YidD [Acidimicrobiia bacterium]MYE68294.1 membrane protein insertion efficiency factor YidD [Acidimicrobiia bacterium]MYJ13968.1 membrane protein insertion efficiency factor YidD [Acidimicrobiia bacterium]
MSFGKRSLLVAIRLYQAFSAVRPPRCRFLPTCSAYAAEAIRVHGAWRGGWYTVRRLAKCQPFGPYGVDPVPPRPGEAIGCEGAA